MKVDIFVAVRGKKSGTLLAQRIQPVNLAREQFNILRDNQGRLHDLIAGFFSEFTVESVVETGPDCASMLVSPVPLSEQESNPSDLLLLRVIDNTIARIRSDTHNWRIIALKNLPDQFVIKNAEIFC